MVLSSEVENYTGFQYIAGEELAEEHLERYKFELKLEEARKVTKEKRLFKVETGKGVYQSKTVIVATGRRPKELNVPGERKFKNRGVTYCATSDAPLFEGMDVAVVEGGAPGWKRRYSSTRLLGACTL